MKMHARIRHGEHIEHADLVLIDGVYHILTAIQMLLEGEGLDIHDSREGIYRIAAATKAVSAAVDEDMKTASAACIACVSMIGFGWRNNTPSRSPPQCSLY
jgi:hypothetical protein